MRCRMCNSDKLSKEFPPVTVSEKCQHPPLVCLQVSYRLNTVKVTLTYQFLYYNQHTYMLKFSHFIDTAMHLTELHSNI